MKAINQRSKASDIIKQFFKLFYFIMGVMVMPLLILDLLVKQDSYVMLWWGMLFSASLSACDIIFSYIPIFKEKLMLKRIIFFILLTGIAIGTSYIMGILTTPTHILMGLAGCAIVGIPLLIYLAAIERKKAKQLNDMLLNYNNTQSKESDKIA